MAYLPEGRSRAKKRAAALLHNYEQSMKQRQAATGYDKRQYDTPQGEGT